jgi:hypothetical protein
MDSVKWRLRSQVETTGRMSTAKVGTAATTETSLALASRCIGQDLGSSEIMTKH